MIEKLRGELAKNLLGIHRHLEYFCSAVCLPLLETEEGLSVLFEIRSQKLKHQPGEICFPGGKIEEKDLYNPTATAIRETMEELNISSEQLEILGSMDTMVTPTGMLIYPFVGMLRDYSMDQYSLDEVEGIICLPLRFFLENQPVKASMEVKINPSHDFPLHLIPHSYQQRWENSSYEYPTYFYQLPDGSLLWGITARILLDFLDVYKRL